MSSKDKNLTPVQQEYKKFEQQREPKRPVLKNCIKAFFVGGLICLIGQLISTFYITYFDFTERSAGNPTVATLIFISMLLTGFGVYDRLGQFAGAGCTCYRIWKLCYCRMYRTPNRRICPWCWR